MYQDQAHKNNALRGLVDQLEADAKNPTIADVARSALDNVAGRLAAILDMPIASPDDTEDAPGTVHMVFRPGDLAVVVAMPDSGGEEQVIVFDRTTVPEGLTGLDRLIVKALLLNALGVVTDA